MNERNKEFVAKKNWDLWQKVLFAGVIVVMIALFLILRTIWWMVAFLFVLVLLSLYYMKNTFKAEYAYTFSNKFLVEILKAGGKRQNVAEFFFSDMTLCGKYNEENIEKVKNVSNVIDAATNSKDSEETYFALFEREGEERLLLFTPNDMMISELKKLVKCNIE
ncbi:MAG: hypothetical protein ACI3XA_04875 [Clostridia bacterium]